MHWVTEKLLCISSYWAHYPVCQTLDGSKRLHDSVPVLCWSYLPALLLGQLYLYCTIFRCNRLNRCISRNRKLTCFPNVPQWLKQLLLHHALSPCFCLVYNPPSGSGCDVKSQISTPAPAVKAATFYRSQQKQQSGRTAETSRETRERRNRQAAKWPSNPAANRSRHSQFS